MPIHPRLAIAGIVLVAALTTASPVVGKASDSLTSVAALDRSARFVSAVSNGRTTVTRASDGTVVLTLDEPLALRVVEPGARRLVLGPVLPDGADTYRPGGRASTRLVVADLRTGGTRVYDVARNVEPEAFGVGNEALFVIDHLPADAPTHYRVGAVDLATGAFGGLIGPDKQPLDLDMSGTARLQVLSESATQLYTLYQQHEHADEPDASRAFVHVLDLRGAWAYCVDLPGVGHGTPGATSIRLARRGHELVVSDRHANTRIAIATAALSLRHLSEGAPPLSTSTLRQ
ncbi:MAG: hypothetical protein ABW033_02760 [Acidimicrobiia bacterium]